MRGGRQQRDKDARRKAWWSERMNILGSAAFRGAGKCYSVAWSSFFIVRVNEQSPRGIAHEGAVIIQSDASYPLAHFVAQVACARSFGSGTGNVWAIWSFCVWGYHESSWQSLGSEDESNSRLVKHDVPPPHMVHVVHMVPGRCQFLLFIKVKSCLK